VKEKALDGRCSECRILAPLDGNAAERVAPKSSTKLLTGDTKGVRYALFSATSRRQPDGLVTIFKKEQR